MRDLDLDVESALSRRGGKRHGDEVTFRCVAHEDDNASADWNRKRHAWHCMACGASGNTVDLAKRLGLEVPDDRPRPVDDWQEVGHWDFTDEHGTLLFRHVKFLVAGKRKQFQFWRPNGSGGWIKNREGVKPVLYRLPALAALKPGDTVILCEGEKDADSALSRGFSATSTPDGAQERGKDQKPARQRWYPEYVPWFRGLNVVLVPDNDQAGHDFMATAGQSLVGTAGSIKWLSITRDMPAKADLTDWFLDGGSAEDLSALIAAAPEWTPESEPTGLSGYPLTDAGNGEVFALLYGDRARYDWLRGRWLLWAGHRWQADPNGELYRLAKLAARARMRAAADEVEDGDRRAVIAKWAIGSENEGRLQAAIARARSEPPIADDGQGWDGQPMLLACANGVVNLVTGKLQPGRPADRITMGSPLPYEPDAPCPRWLQFLEEVLPDAAVREFMRLAIGYCLTGITREQVWFLCYGTGANGKGTLFDVLRWVMGDLAHVMAFSTIERGKEQSIASDMAALAGKRLVLTSETQEHSRFNEARIKSLTGEDPITARELYQKQFTFEPVLKLMIGVNHKPVVTDDSFGFWRRVAVIPFTETFGADRRDDTLRDTLKQELVGILAWAVQAAVDWGKQGLVLPPAVAVATVEYKEESDIFGQFITECCIEGDAYRVAGSSFYKAYRAWCEAQGMRDREVISATTFGRRMGEKYAKRKTHGGTSSYMGIGLLAENAHNPPRGEGYGEGYRLGEGFSGKSTSRNTALAWEFPENPPQPSPPPRSDASNISTRCDGEECELDHWMWGDGTVRHGPERAISKGDME